MRLSKISSRASDSKKVMIRSSRISLAVALERSSPPVKETIRGITNRIISTMPSEAAADSVASVMDSVVALEDSIPALAPVISEVFLLALEVSITLEALEVEALEAVASAEACKVSQVVAARWEVVWEPLNQRRLQLCKESF